MDIEVDVNGVKIAFKRGKKSIPLIYIHGSGCDSSLWDKQLEEIGGFAIDLPGHGFSDDTNINSVYDYAFYVANAAKNLFDKAVFLGHSLGGAIVQEIYLNFKDCVLGIILVGTGARLRVLPELLDGLERRDEKVIDKFVEMSFANATESMKNDMKKRFLENIEILLRDLKACDKFDLLGKYKAGEIKIDVPTLIVVGEKDKLTPVKYSQFFKSVIPQAELKVIKDAGHMVMLEKAKGFNHAILEFLNKRNFL